MKKIILFWAIIGWQSVFSQPYDLRNIVLNSDFIIVVETEQEKISTKPINDFYYERSVTFSNIDKVIKQNGKINFLNQSIFYPKEGNDFFKDDIYGIAVPPPPKYIDIVDIIYQKYYSIYFLKKDKQKKLYVLSSLNDLSLSDKNNRITQIEEILKLEQYKNPQERYEKTMDYFIQNNFYPDDNFLAYYQSIGILKSHHPVLTEKQLSTIKERLVQGEMLKYTFEEILSEKYPEQLKDFHLKRMINIRDSADYTSTYEFELSYETITNTRYSQDEPMIEYLKNKLYDSNVGNEERQKIMDILIENAQKIIANSETP